MKVNIGEDDGDERNRIIKYYSPMCSYCKMFAPTWKKVASLRSSTPIPTTASAKKLEFANLNCIAYGDICDEEGVTSYPSVQAYSDGKKVSSFTGHDRSLEMVLQFVDKVVAEIPKRQRKLASQPNPAGESTVLDAEKFTKLITTTRDSWFVKFYAPWCGHCKAMASAWAALGKEMIGELNIGEVDCETEKRLCKDIKIKGYPTILYFQNGERVEYDGLRGLGDLVSYAHKAADSAVKETDDDHFKRLQKTGDMEVAFVYFYDHATTTEDFTALDRLTLNLIGHAPIFKTQDEDMAKRFRVFNRPKLIVVRDERPSYYNALAPHDMRDYNKVLSWMRSVWLPIVPELSAANSHQIMNNHIVVLGILNREKHDDFDQARKELKEAAHGFMQQRVEDEQAERKRLRDAKNVRLQEAEDRNDERGIKAAKGTKINVPQRREVHFAWVDGVFWERWVRTTYGVNVNTDGAKIIINDEDVVTPTHFHSS